MVNKDVEQIAIIRDSMLENPNAKGLFIWEAAKLALEDKYLYELMLDWMIVTDSDIKNMLMEEVVNYTEEILRKIKINTER